MARKSREELVERFTAYAGDRNDDDTLSFLEDLSDSLTPDGEDWKAKFEENDKQWRERYKSRFLEMSPTNTIQPDPATDEETHDDVDIPEENEDIEKSPEEQLNELFGL